MDTSINQSNLVSNLNKTQSWLKSQGVAAILVRSTDKYFNEYVPKSLSIRTQITGFDGSIGDAIITKNGAHLFVDGRYGIQARKQALGFSVHVCANNESIESTWRRELPNIISRGESLSFDPATLDLNLFDSLKQWADGANLKLLANAAEFFATIINPKDFSQGKRFSLTAVEESLSGQSTVSKISDLSSELKTLGIDGFLLVKLDDISWLINHRSNYFPYQSAVPAIACVMANKIIVGLSPDVDFDDDYRDSSVEFVEEDKFFHLLKQKNNGHKLAIGIDAQETSIKHQADLMACEINIKRVANPVLQKKAIKNEKELLHMRWAFKKADTVVNQTQDFVTKSYQEGKPLSEGEIDDFVQEAFAKSNAHDLSFRPICAGGKNGALIHYGTPDCAKKVEQNSLFLLDTGAYYQGGYATDLTRTFLAAPKDAPAKPWQKEMFTLVLKASIRGLSARFKRGTLGMQLDARVREPLWQHGLDFAHGTGHGVGINVHEFPPRIGPTSTTPLLEHQVFSIEPGLYFEGVGGVRIENLATIVADPKHKDFLRVLPLTFCPLDQRLIEASMLDDAEQEFLRYFEDQWHNDAPMPDLPPLRDISFT